MSKGLLLRIAWNHSKDGQGLKLGNVEDRGEVINGHRRRPHRCLFISHFFS